MARFPSELDGSLFDIDLHVLDSERISAALKGEVGLVQGKRRRLRPWSKSKSYADVKDANGAGGDSRSIVTEMSGMVLKFSCPPSSPSQKARGQEKDDLRRETERLFRGFCITHGAHFQLPDPYLSGDVDKGKQLFTHNSGGQNDDRRESKEGGRQSEGGGGGGGGGEQESNRTSLPSASEARGSGGATGGDRQPPTSSESEFSHKGAFSPSPDPTPDTTTTEADVEEHQTHHEDEGRKKYKAHSRPLKPSIRFSDDILPTPYKNDDNNDIPSSSPSHHVRILESKPKPSFSATIQGFTYTAGKRTKKSTIDMGSSHYSSRGPQKRSLLKMKGSVISGILNHSSSPSSSSTIHRKSTTRPHTRPSSSVPSHYVVAARHHDHPLPQKRSILQRHSLGKRVIHPTYNYLNSRASAGGGILVSSVEEVARSIKYEKDSSWLEWSSSEDENNDEDGRQHDADLMKRRSSRKSIKKLSLVDVQQDLRMFLESTRILNKINLFMGLYPYQRIVRSNHCMQVLWVPKTWRYLRVCLNAILFFAFTVSAFASLAFLVTAGFTGNKSVTHQIVHFMFAIHFPETLFLITFSFFLSVWSISCVMELGQHYAEFFNRFNLAICLLKYDVTEEVNEMIIKHLVTVGFTLLITTFLFFGGGKGAFVRDTLGFFGYCILRPFNFAVRESIYYPLVELFGLMVLHYFFFCVSIVLLQFAVYGKCIGNMAGKFNLRLAYVLGKLTEVGPCGEEKLVKKVIPYEKLHAEHLIIVSLFRNMSQVNEVVFKTFLLCMTFEIVLVIWLFFDMFLDPGHTLDEGYLHHGDGAAVQIPVPLRVDELYVEAIAKSIGLFFVTFITFASFGGVMHTAAEKLHNGMDCIRRHGLILCESSKERKFILSMMNSFTTKTAYWIGKNFSFNRPSILQLVGFTIATSIVTISYRPEQIDLVSVEKCSEDGLCLSIQLSEGNKNLFYSGLDEPLLQSLDGLHPPMIPLPPPIVITSTPAPPPIFFEKFPPELYIWRSPANWASEYPYKTENHLVYKCPTKWAQPKELTFLSFYKRMYIDIIDNFYNYFGRIKDPFTTSSFDDYTSCPNATHYLYNFPYASAFGMKSWDPITDMFVYPISRDSDLFDHCGNIYLMTPKSINSWPSSMHENPIRRLIPMNQLPEFRMDDQRFFCCLEYAMSPDEVRVCNLPDPETIEKRCSFSRWKPKYHYLVQKLIRLREKGQDVLANSVPFNDSKRHAWTQCLCNDYQIACINLRRN